MWGAAGPPANIVWACRFVRANCEHGGAPTRRKLGSTIEDTTAVGVSWVGSRGAFVVRYKEEGKDKWKSFKVTTAVKDAEGGMSVRDEDNCKMEFERQRDLAVEYAKRHGCGDPRKAHQGRRRGQGSASWVAAVAHAFFGHRISIT